MASLASRCFGTIPFTIVSSLATVLLHSSVIHAADRSGKEVVDAVCIGCHGPGTDGAPRVGNAADWAPRAAKGIDKLSQNAITGVRKMPAHGGQASLNDLEMTRAVAYLVSGGRTPDPSKPYTVVSSGSGKEIVDAACGNCHREGKDGAPKIGDLDAWKPRLTQGVENLVTSATRGHNNMPARGGLANLSDVDIRAAVSYMTSQLSGAKKP